MGTESLQQTTELSQTERREFSPPVRRNTIQAGEAIKTMEKMKDNTVDCIVADPPYNLSQNGEWDWDEKQWDMVSESWDEMGWGDYAEFTYKWITEAARILKPTGTIWVFASYHNSPFVNLAIREHGEILNEITWFKRNAFPNMSGSRFTASQETIYWGHLNGEDRQYKFNYDTVKESMECPEDQYTEAGKQIRSVWDIPTNKSSVEKEVDHPTQKPLRVYERIIPASTDEGDMVFVPFIGSGNAALSAKLNNRDYFGVDVNVEYAKNADEYVNSVDEKPDMIDSIIIDS